jgi:cysteinyl-tRNA synthetase
MDDDLSVPAALATLQGVLREGNKLLAAVDGGVRDEPSRSGASVIGGPAEALRGSLMSVRAMLDVLGLDPLSPTWTGSESATGLHDVVERLVAVTLAERQEARARKDFGAADRIRASLLDAGVAVEDTPSGPRWTLVEHDSDGTVADGR